MLQNKMVSGHLHPTDELITLTNTRCFHVFTGHQGEEGKRIESQKLRRVQNVGPRDTPNSLVMDLSFPSTITLTDKALIEVIQYRQDAPSENSTSGT